MMRLRSARTYLASGLDSPRSCARRSVFRWSSEPLACVLVRRVGGRLRLTRAVLSCLRRTWYAAYARDAKHVSFSFGSATISFISLMGRAAFVGLGQSRFVAVALGVVAVSRCRIWPCGHAFADRHGATPAIVTALVAGSFTFALVTAVARSDVWRGAGGLLRPLQVRRRRAPAAGDRARRASSSARYWVVLGAVPLLLLALGVPGNVDLLRGIHQPVTLELHESR